MNVLGNIEAQIERANSIIDNVRAYAKGLHKTRQKVDLKVIIDQSITAFRSTGRYPKVDIFVETDPGVVFDANPLEWELVTHNLVKMPARPAKIRNVQSCAWGWSIWRLTRFA